MPEAATRGQILTEIVEQPSSVLNEIDANSTSMLKPAPAVYKEPLQKQETAEEANKRKTLLFTNALMSLTP